MPATGWARRRGLATQEDEWNAPYARLARLLEQKHSHEGPGRHRHQRPDPGLVANLPILLRQASAALDRDVRRSVGARHGLTATEVDVIRRLGVRRSSGTQLCEYLRATPSQVSRLVTRLEDRDLVMRVEVWQDQRLRRAELTDAGVDLAAELDDDLEQLTVHWADEVDPDALDVVLLALAVLADLP